METRQDWPSFFPLTVTGSVHSALFSGQGY
jgi:hypothetical protein